MFKILVVDDEKDLNKTVCSFLNHSGYEAVGCLSAVEAYDALTDNIFDLIISDIMMPGVDGFEFAENIDLNRAKAARDKAELMIARAKDEHSMNIAKAKLYRAINRIDVKESLK